MDNEKESGMIKIYLFVIGLFLVSITGTANAGNQFSDSWSEVVFVPCLGESVQQDFEFNGIYKEFFDANGGLHINMNGKLAGDFASLDSDKTWTGRGRLHWILNSNMEWVPGGNGNNQMQFRRTYLEQLTVVADGLYPDLLWTLEFTLMINANFEIVKAYADFGTISCLSD
jgi:hypothetical protein